MSIILTILRIIGIVLLMILGIVIVLILLLLFAPVRYKAAGTYEQECADVLGTVRWLMGAVSLTVQYKSGQPFHIRAKVFFVPIFDNLKERKKTKKERKPQLQAASSNKEEQTDEETLQEEASVKAQADKRRTTENEWERDFEKQDSETTKPNTERTVNETDDDKTDKRTVFEKIKAFFEKLVEIVRNIKFTFRKICAIIVKIRDNIKYYWELLQQEDTKQAFGLCTRQFSKIIKNIAPKKYEVKLHLGFEDPATMGNVLAVWGMLYPFHMGNVDILPEFEQKVVECCFRVKGRLSVYVFLWTAWLLLTDKNIKQLRRQLHL